MGRGATPQLDLEAVLVVRPRRSVCGRLQPLTQALMDRLTELVGCEFARYKEIDLAKRIEIAYVPCTAEVQLRARRGDLAGGMERLLRERVQPCRPRGSKGPLLVLRARIPGVMDAGDVRAFLLEETLGQEECVDRMWIGFLGLPYAGVTLDRLVGPSTNGLVCWHALCNHT